MIDVRKKTSIRVIRIANIESFWGVGGGGGGE